MFVETLRNIFAFAEHFSLCFLYIYNIPEQKLFH